MKFLSGQVQVWEEALMIPTYEVGAPDKNPMFLEKRVYQGSTGKVYPYPVIDKIFDEKIEKEYHAIWLENDYLKVMILPELGGRIQRAIDKTNNYDFVYYNEVIKPALVGLTGPWISGGIEFNWPQHHRPTTFAPTDYSLHENEDGSKTVHVGEVDQMYGTKGMASFTLYPDKAYIEIKGQLYNRTNLPQTFLWWANPAVPVNDYTQSIFPPDVHAVMDHGKRDVSKFPIATGVYYKHDYSEGVDISRYKNIPVPTSYMAEQSDFDFVGGYDYKQEAGILHIADHHVSPGKKQWTWGCGDFGKAWDRNLTDENGPYIELMTGMFTDNQPDFTWLKPFEEKTFTQYFMPYKKAENVKNASSEVVLNLTFDEETAAICVYCTAKYENARVLLTYKETECFECFQTLSPTEILTANIPAKESVATDFTLSVYDASGRLMLSYTPAPAKDAKLPSPAAAALQPEEIASCEELYLTGLHIEQYRHATYDPDPYYLEGLRRDPGDLRINNAYGALLMRRGLFVQAETYFRKAIERMTWKNPNPYDSEPYLNLGLSLFYQDRMDDAFDAFYKAIWTSAQQEIAFYYLAAIASRKGNYRDALSFVERSLIKNSRNLKARGLKAVLLIELGSSKQAEVYLKESIEADPFDYMACLELATLTGAGKGQTLQRMANRVSSFIELAIDYSEAGFYMRAIEALRLCTAKNPMLKYYEAYMHNQCDDTESCNIVYSEAALRDPVGCFPNRLEDQIVLTWAVEYNPFDSRAPYYLGNLCYDKKQYDRARILWEESCAIVSDYPTVWRNLSLAYFNKTNEHNRAQDAMEKAFSLDTTDARIFLELDQLYKKRGVSPKDRLVRFEQYRETFLSRDDLCVEYATLLNLLGQYEKAYEFIMKHRFHPWEGGEGKITTQYTVALLQMAKNSLAQHNPKNARDLLKKALVFPENLGEGKLEGAKDNNLYYYLGLAEHELENEISANSNWQRAIEGDNEPAGMMYYNDQPADLILYQGLALRALGRETEANICFHKLVEYGERHIDDVVRTDYFAVSLPDLQLFEEDLTVRNRAHCNYLIGLGNYGLGENVRAATAYKKTLDSDSAHLGAVLHAALL